MKIFWIKMNQYGKGEKIDIGEDKFYKKLFLEKNDFKTPQDFFGAVEVGYSDITEKEQNPEVIEYTLMHLMMEYLFIHRKEGWDNELWTEALTSLLLTKDGDKDWTEMMRKDWPTPQAFLSELEKIVGKVKDRVDWFRSYLVRHSHSQTLSPEWIAVAGAIDLIRKNEAWEDVFNHEWQSPLQVIYDMPPTSETNNHEMRKKYLNYYLALYPYLKNNRRWQKDMEILEIQDSDVTGLINEIIITADLRKKLVELKKKDK